MNVLTENGRGVMVQSGGDPIATKVWIRLNTPRGALFNQPDLGHRFHLVKKANDEGAALLSNLAMETLKPLKDNRQVKDINITAIAKPAEGRIDLRIVLTTANDNRVQFETFYKVI